MAPDIPKLPRGKYWSNKLDTFSVKFSMAGDDRKVIHDPRLEDFRGIFGFRIRDYPGRPIDPTLLRIGEQRTKKKAELGELFRDLRGN
jgi:hypothetical protein